MMIERFFADLLPVRFEQFADVSDEPWTDPHYQLLWSRQQDFSCSDGYRMRSVPRSRLLLVKPNRTVQLTSYDRLSIRRLRFGAPFLQSLQAQDDVALLPVSPHGKSLLMLIQSYRARMPDPHERLRLSCLLLALLGECLLIPQSKQQDEHPTEAGGKRSQRPKSGLPIVYAVRYMRKNLANPDLSLNEIAASVGYNRNYFCQEFGQIFGVSPIRHLNELRVNQALRLLAETDDQVQEICRNVGIRTPGHLTALVKERLGLTPVAYRRSVRRDL